MESESNRTVRLRYRPPLDWPALLGFFAVRTIPGVELVSDGTYRRTVLVGGQAGTIAVRPAAKARLFELVVRLPDSPAVLGVAVRARRMFDLDSDPRVIAAHLGRDPGLCRVFAAHPGLRVPGAWDGFELAVRAVLGQQVSVRAARTLAGRIVERFGDRVETGIPGLERSFPLPDRLAGAPLESVGLTRRRAATIRSVASAVAAGDLDLGPGASAADTTERLRAIAGIGEWTAEYVALRALADRDAFPQGDLGLRRAFGNGAGPANTAVLRAAAEAWRPWRAYAAIALWATDGPLERRGG